MDPQEAICSRVGSGSVQRENRDNGKTECSGQHGMGFIVNLQPES